MAPDCQESSTRARPAVSTLTTATLRHAWASPTPSRPGTVIRGGYGLTFFPGNATSGSFMKNAPYSFNFSCGDTATPVNQPSACSTPVAGTNGSWLLDGGLPVPSTNLTLATDPTTYASQGAFNITDFDFKSSYLHQYSLNLEKDFNGNVATLAYVGNLGKRL